MQVQKCVVASEIKTTICLIVAHGENWEVAATRAAANLVEKIREERRQSENSREDEQENGRFELQYIPSNPNAKPIKIAFSALQENPPVISNVDSRNIHQEQLVGSQSQGSKEKQTTNSPKYVTNRL